MQRRTGTVTGTVRSLYREEHHQGLDLETFQKERRSRKLCYFSKIFQGEFPNHLFKMILIVRGAYNTVKETSLSLPQ